VAFLQKLFLHSKATSKRRKLLIGRPRGASRQVTGWEVFKNLLIRNGFQEVQPETLSIKEQAQVFFEAEWVIGIHGAALTNIVFCRPGTKIVEILGQQYVNPCYRALSEAAGLRYHALIGESWHHSPILKLDQPEAPIRLNLKKVRRFLHFIGLK
jgi:capsular polysaccharide biosynthesis protein